MKVVQIDLNNLSKGYYKVDEEIEAVLGKDHGPGYSVIHVPQNDDNKQMIVVSDCRDYKTKIYTRQRLDKHHPWSGWELKSTISLS